MNNPYIEAGFNSREQYLTHLSQVYGIDIATVKEIANLLGPNEDFDGLVDALQNAELSDENLLDDFFDRCLR